MPDVTMSTLTIAKRAVRSRIKSTLKTLSADSVASQSETCTRTVLSLPEYVSARSISVFLSMPLREIDTTPLVLDALAAGKRVFVPYIHRTPPSRPVASLAESASAPPGVMDMLSLGSVEDFKGLARDNWGIPTISEESVMVRKDAMAGDEGVDVVIMPGVGFDSEFGRVGHGKGYYDYWLTRYMLAHEGRRKPILVAVALKEQVLGEGETVPRDETDWRMDVVCVGDGRCLRRGTEE